MRLIVKWYGYNLSQFEIIQEKFWHKRKNLSGFVMKQKLSHASNWDFKKTLKARAYSAAM